MRAVHVNRLNNTLDHNIAFLFQLKIVIERILCITECTRERENNDPVKHASVRICDHLIKRFAPCNFLACFGSVYILLDKLVSLALKVTHALIMLRLNCK